jgi:hypothetical protein
MKEIFTNSSLILPNLTDNRPNMPDKIPEQSVRTTDIKNLEVKWIEKQKEKQKEILKEDKKKNEDSKNEEKQSK